MDNALSLVRAALSHAGEDQERLERLSQLEERRITPDKELPPMEFLFKLFGRPCFPRGELVGLTGKPKSGKTFVSSVLMTLCFKDEVLSITRMAPGPLRVLWYDTEQSDESTQDILVHRIMTMTGSDYQEKCFDVFNVRQVSWRERLPMLEVAIEEYRPDFVLLDGIRDLVNDINDGVLAQDTVERLMHLASEQRCCIVCIIHQNKSAEDKNLRGWIGTELTHKSFEVYECEKDGNRVFSFCQKLTRKYDIIDTLKYVVDENGIPEIASVEKMAENQQNRQYQSGSLRPDLNMAYLIEWKDTTPVLNLASLFMDAMPEEGKLYAAKNLQVEVMKLANITSTSFYSKQRDLALNDGIIKKTANEFGHIVYYRPKSVSLSATTTVPEEPDLFKDSPGDVPF